MTTRRLTRPRATVRICAAVLFAARVAPCGEAPRVVPTLGARVGAPTGVTLSFALIRGFDQGSPCPGHDPTGPTASLEAGTGGAGVAVGFGTACAPYPLVGLAGFAARATYVRTWGDTWSTRPAESYVGVYGDATLGVTLRLGALRHVGASRNGVKDWMFVIGGGVGF